jgi:ribosomal-protein-alanine N-acetyltransferase
MAAQPRWPDGPVDQIVAVMERAFDPAFGEAWSRRQVEDALLLGTCRFALGDADGAIGETLAAPAVGFYLARTVLDEAELLLIAVDPSLRGRGLGTALLAHFADGARKRGARRAFLEMRRGNPAGALYEAHGFRAIGERRSYYRSRDGTRHDAVSYERLFPENN